MQRTRKFQTLLLSIALALLLGGGGYTLYRRQASASVIVPNFPSWVSSDLVQRVNSTWSLGQTWILREILNGKSGIFETDRCGSTTLVTPNATEISMLGPDVKTFVSYSGKSSLASGTSSSYTDPFRIAIKADPIQRTGGNNGIMQVRIVFTNQSNHNMYLKSTELSYNIMGITPGQLMHYSVGGGYDYVNPTQVTYFPPGYNSSVITRNVNIFNVDNAAYTVAWIKTIPYNFNNNSVSYGDNQEVMSCFIEPFDIHALGGGSSAYAMAPEPSATFTYAYPSPITSTPIPSRTSTIAPTVTTTSTTAPTITPTRTTTSTSVAPAETNYSFNRGFTAFGMTAQIPLTKMIENSLTTYRFDGVSNSWVYYPGMTQFNIEAGKGYYVYSATAKTVSLPFIPQTTSTYSLTKGWNLFYNVGDKTLSSLQMSYNGVTKSAEEMINSGTIYSRVFIIDNDQATQACNYFKLLGSTNSVADCAASSLASTTTLPSSKAFWIYVF